MKRQRETGTGDRRGVGWFLGDASRPSLPTPFLPPSFFSYLPCVDPQNGLPLLSILWRQDVNDVREAARSEEGRIEGLREGGREEERRGEERVDEWIAEMVHCRPFLPAGRASHHHPLPPSLPTSGRLVAPTTSTPS